MTLYKTVAGGVNIRILQKKAELKSETQGLLSAKVKD